MTSILVERPVQLRGSAVARMLLRLAGWTLRFDGLPANQGVAIVYPHTSNWDFVIGVLAKWGIGIPVMFWGKDSLFRVPLFGRWLRWIGGVPVDRRSAHGIVADMAGRLRTARAEGRFLWLALAPEGTRGAASGWRSGFYHVALAAGVPLGLVHMDWRARSVGIDRFLMLSGDRDADLRAIADDLGHRIGRHPEAASPIQLT